MYDANYETSFIGPTTIIAFNASTGATTKIRLVSAGAAGLPKKRSFAVRVTTAARILQGGKDVTTTGASGTAPGMQFPTTVRWRVDVRSNDEAFLSVLGDTSAGDIEITQLNDVGTSDPPVAV